MSARGLAHTRATDNIGVRLWRAIPGNSRQREAERAPARPRSSPRLFDGGLRATLTTMAVTVVLDYPQRHLLRRAWRQFAAFWGGTLLVVGVLASLVAFPTTLALVSIVVAGDEEPAPGEEPWPPPEWPVDEIILAWGISTPMTIVGIGLGIRLLRGKRGLVLFLRRFGYEDATKALSFAAAKTVGGSWRLVTLDDAAIAPLGIPARTRRLYSAGGRALSAAGKFTELLWTRLLPLTLAAMAAVIGIELLRAPDWRAALDDGTFEPYSAAVDSLMNREVPLDAIGWSLPGVFAILAIFFTLVLATGFLTFGLMLLMFPLAPVLFFLLASSMAVEKAEQATTRPIHDKTDVWHATQAVAQLSQRVFAPRLVVLRVATPVWKQTVKGFAEVCSAPLIDLSDVSENVLWEIEELTRTFGRRCLLVGQHDRVAWLVDPPEASAGSSEGRLLQLLDGYEVLAYTTDPRGTRRFARSLRARLLTVTT